MKKTYYIVAVSQVFLALLIFAAPASGDTVTPNTRRTILFLGDSLTAGYGLDQRESYPSRIQEKIDEQGLPYRVINAGVSGDTTAGGLRRLKWLLRQHVDVFVVALGANDGLRGIAPEETEKNLRAIIQTAREKNPKAQIVLAGMRVPPNMGPRYTQAFETVFPRVSKETNSLLIPFLLEGVAAEPELNLPDGIHPNAEGYTIVADLVWRSLKPLIVE